MAKCRACGKFIAQLGGARCGGCSAIYHKACVAIPEVTQIPSDWMCPECKCRIPKTGNSATPVKGIASSYNVPSPLQTTSLVVDSDVTHIPGPATSMTPEVRNLNEMAHDPTRLFSVELGLEIRLFREELREVRQEFKDLRQEIFDLRSVLSRSNDRIDGLEKRMNMLENMKNTNDSSRVSALEQTICQLKLDINDRDQDILQADFEVSNLPEEASENPIQTVLVLAAKLGMTLKQEDVVFAERVGKTVEGNKDDTKRSRRLVVRLSRRQLRNELIHSARVRRGATSADLGINLPPRRFYVNERLTSINRKLFYSTREAARDSQWKYTWTKKGRIYTRQGDGKPVCTIRSEVDLARVFGSGIVRGDGEHRI